jgi:hypothetical protein
VENGFLHGFSAAGFSGVPLLTQKDRAAIATIEKFITTRLGDRMHVNTLRRILVDGKEARIIETGSSLR